jgi:restriction endonuclease S subunit
LIKPNRNKIKGNFLLRIFQSKKINDQFVISANGVTRFGISTYRIKNSLVIIPPLHDQTAIASFLDKKTVKIDALIEKDRKLIELLKEKRTALINHAVTKGLNPPLTPPLSGRGIVGKYEGGNLKYIPYNPALKDMARENRENPTPAEKKMWEFLQNKELEGLKFTRQKPLDKFIVDFYCAELRLAVEIDGEYHNNQKEQDKTRSEILWDKYKIRVIRYTNDQILNNPKEVLDDLLEKIKDRLASGATQLNAEFPPDKVDKRGFKDSGIEWIGKIPVGWDVRRIKHLTFNLDGKRVPVSADLREEGDVPYYGATGVLDYVNDYIFNEDLLLIGEDGAPFFDKGKNVAFLISGKSWVNNHAHVLRVNKNISRSWLCYFLNANDYTPYIKGSTRDKLNQDELSNIFVVMPKKRDQTAIANYLDKATAKIDKTIQKIEKKIALLEEYKKSLIHHVVTGKVDVRGIEA